LQFDKVEDNGGSTVTSYNLYVDRGTENAHNFTRIQTYDGKSLEWTILKSSETYLVTG